MLLPLPPWEEQMILPACVCCSFSCLSSLYCFLFSLCNSWVTPAEHCSVELCSVEHRSVEHCSAEHCFVKHRSEVHRSAESYPNAIDSPVPPAICASFLLYPFHCPPSPAPAAVTAGPSRSITARWTSSVRSAEPRCVSLPALPTILTISAAKRGCLSVEMRTNEPVL